MEPLRLKTDIFGNIITGSNGLSGGRGATTGLVDAGGNQASLPVPGLPSLPSSNSNNTSPAPGNPNGVIAAPKPVLNRAAVDNTQRTIDQIPGLLEAALASERTRFSNILNEFGVAEQGQRKVYDESTVNNQKNYDANFMDSILAGSKGLSGLISLLRGTGAAGGTAESIARDTVGGVTSQDIRGGADTRNENQTALDTTLNTFTSDLDRKRRAAEDTRVNNERAISRDSDTQLQELFGKMAGFYGDVGDTNGATSWMNRAGDLTPRIAQNSRTQVSAYDTAPVAVKAPELTAFAGSTQPEIKTAIDGQVGAGIFTMTDNKRRKSQEVAPLVPVGV